MNQNRRQFLAKLQRNFSKWLFMQMRKLVKSQGSPNDWDYYVIVSAYLRVLYFNAAIIPISILKLFEIRAALDYC